jgi:HD-GYP domain-containing protein (c-di-GMP phosphodiesterase class II)
MKLGNLELQDIAVAALLRDIGKLALPDRLAGKPIEVLSSEERREFTKHPVKGQAALMALEQLAGAARLIRSQHERYDGMGYPDRLSDSEIPLGARILAVASDYDGLQRGLVTNRCLSTTQAQAFIVDGRGKRYDPQVVDAFVDAVGVTAVQPAPVAEEQMTPAQLQSGMVLTRDLLTRDGILLLSRDYVLDPALIENIRNYEENDAHPVNVHVRAMNGG